MQSALVLQQVLQIAEVVLQNFKSKFYLNNKMVGNSRHKL